MDADADAYIDTAQSFDKAVEAHGRLPSYLRNARLTVSIFRSISFLSGCKLGSRAIFWGMKASLLSGSVISFG